MIATQTVTYLGVFAAPGTVPGTRRRLHRLVCLAAATAAAGALFSALARPVGQTTAASAPLTGPIAVAALTVAGVLVAVYAAPGPPAADPRPLSALLHWPVPPSPVCPWCSPVTPALRSRGGWSSPPTRYTSPPASPGSEESSG